MESSIKTIGVIGAGTMGGGIAHVAAQSGFDVILYDVTEELVRRAFDRIAAFVRRAVEKGRLSPEAGDATLARLRPATALEAMAAADFVVEAAPERLDLKRQIFERLDAICPPEAILATNTSTLSVTSMASATRRPGKVVGMHFFNPPALMPLVEVAATPTTSDATLATTVALAEALGKVPVRTKDTPGFIVNRVARPFYLEGLRLLGEGIADHATIDRLVREGGNFRMGPFELMDLIGIDVNYAASQSVYDAYFGEPRFRPHPLQQRQVESGNLGRKTGRGWYVYEDEG